MGPAAKRVIHRANTLCRVVNLNKTLILPGAGGGTGEMRMNSCTLSLRIISLMCFCFLLYFAGKND